MEGTKMRVSIFFLSCVACLISAKTAAAGVKALWKR